MSDAPEILRRCSCPIPGTGKTCTRMVRVPLNAHPVLCWQHAKSHTALRQQARLVEHHRRVSAEKAAAEEQQRTTRVAGARRVWLGRLTGLSDAALGQLLMEYHDSTVAQDAEWRWRKAALVDESERRERRAGAARVVTDPRPLTNSMADAFARRHR